MAERGVLEEERLAGEAPRFRFHPRPSLRAAKRARERLRAEREPSGWLQLSGGARFEALAYAAERGRIPRTVWPRGLRERRPASLSEAICFGDTRATREFLRAGWDPNEKDESKLLPPLGLAASVGAEGAVAALLEFGARPTASAVGKAVRLGNTGIVRRLVRAGMAPEQLGGALHSAACLGHLALARLLLRAGADPNWCPAPDIFPALRWVLAYEDEAMARLLAKHGAVGVVTRSPEDGRRDALFDELCEAASAGRSAAIRRLLRKGVSPNPRLAIEPNPLCEAAQAGSLASVRALLEGGADPRIFGDIPAVHWAVCHDDLAMLKLLVAAGASPRERDSDGETPLSIAEERGHHRLAAYLRSQRRAGRGGS